MKPEVLQIPLPVQSAVVLHCLLLSNKWTSTVAWSTVVPKDYFIFHLHQDNKEKALPILLFAHRTQGRNFRSLHLLLKGSQATSSPGNGLSHIVAEGTAWQTNQQPCQLSPQPSGTGEKQSVSVAAKHPQKHYTMDNPTVQKWVTVGGEEPVTEGGKT